MPGLISTSAKTMKYNNFKNEGLFYGPEIEGAEISIMARLWKVMT